MTLFITKTQQTSGRAKASPRSHSDSFHNFPVTWTLPVMGIEWTVYQLIYQLWINGITPTSFQIVTCIGVEQKVHFKKETFLNVENVCCKQNEFSRKNRKRRIGTVSLSSWPQIEKIWVFKIIVSN